MELPKELIDIIEKHAPPPEVQEEFSKKTPREKLEFECKVLNNRKGNTFDNEPYHYDCPICKNKGYVYTVETKELELANGEKQSSDYLMATQCDCWKVRESLKILAESGLTETMQKETFDTYKTPNEWQATIKQKALDFLSSETPFFYIGGFTGSGKTKICTCILSEYIKQLKSVRYIVWNDYISEIMSNMEIMDESIAKLQKVDILYIDDLYKFAPKDFEKKVLFRIVNYRARNGLKTLFSSELKLINKTKVDGELYDYGDIISIDLAVGGRIYESAGKGEFVITIPNLAKYNMRFKELV